MVSGAVARRAVSVGSGLRRLHCLVRCRGAQWGGEDRLHQPTAGTGDAIGRGGVDRHGLAFAPCADDGGGRDDGAHSSAAWPAARFRDTTAARHGRDRGIVFVNGLDLVVLPVLYRWMEQRAEQQIGEAQPDMPLTTVRSPS